MDEIYRPTREQRKETEALDNLVGPVGIRNGLQVKNWAVDQNLVIGYLSRIPSSSGGALYATGPALFRATRDGFCDGSLFEAIRRFQQANGLGSDGVVDPGGPTLRALKSLAARGSSGGAVRPDGKEQEFIDKVYVLIGVLRILVNKRPTILTTAQLAESRLILADLENLVARSGIKPKTQPLPVQNNTGVLVGVGVLIALGIAILAITAYPPWQKAAKVMADGIVEGIDQRTRRLGQLMQQAQDAAVEAIVDGIVELNKKAYEITSQGCRPDFNAFERQATKLTYDLYHRPALAPQTIKAFLDALMDLMRCLGPGAAPLLQLLRKGWRTGETLIDLLVKAMGGNTALYPLLRR